MTIAPSSPAPAPPKGWRPHISMRAKLESVLAQDGRCPRCGERLGQLAGLDWDHSPPIAMRPWCEVTGDTIPPASDPSGIVAMHRDCHRAKTSGGAAKAKASGDVTEIARTKRLASEQDEFRRRVLAKEPGKPRERKSKIKSRGFAPRTKTGR